MFHDEDDYISVPLVMPEAGVYMLVGKLPITYIEPGEVIPWDLKDPIEDIDPIFGDGIFPWDKKFNCFVIRIEEDNEIDVYYRTRQGQHRYQIWYGKPAKQADIDRNVELEEIFGKDSNGF